MGRRKSLQPGKGDEPTDEHRAVAKAVVSGGKDLKNAMLGAGFSESYANKGRDVLRNSQPFRTAFSDEINAVGDLAEGVDITDGRLSTLMRWRMTLNLTQGKDNASNTIRSVGNLKGINAFVSASLEGSGGILAVLADP